MLATGHGIHGDVASEHNGSVESEVKSARPEPKVRILELSFPERAAFSTIWERPLFMPNRRPHAEAAAPRPARAAPPPPPRVELSGIIKVGGTRRALLAMPPAGAEMYREGDSLRGWRLLRIDADRIELGFAGRRVQVLLDERDGRSEGAPQDATAVRSGTPGSLAPTRSIARTHSTPTIPDMSEQID